MKHVVLKPFGWYPDGYSREALVPGDERDFGDATDGLLAAKMIGEIIKPVQTVPSAEAPIVAVDAEIAPVATPDAEEFELLDTADKPRRSRKPRQG